VGNVQTHSVVVKCYVLTGLQFYINIKPWRTSVYLNYLWNSSLNSKKNTVHVHSRDQLCYAKYGNNDCTKWKTYETHNCCLWAKATVSECYSR